MSNSSRKWFPTLKIAVAIAAFSVLFLLVDVRALFDALANLTWGMVGYLLLLSVALVLVSAMKWQFFIEARGKRVSLLRLFHLYILGYFVNLLVPSYVGGDVVRSWYVGRETGEQHEAFAATILERYTGFVAMLTLALLFMWQVENVTWQIQCVVIGLCFALGGLTTLALSSKLLLSLKRVQSLHRLVVHAEKIQKGFLLARSKPRLLAKALALSFLFHSLTVVNVLAAGFAVAWFYPPVGDLFVVLPLILLIGAIPISPSGLGIQESAFFFFLTGLGASEAQALGIGLLLRAKSYVLALWGGALWLIIDDFQGLSLRSSQR